MVRAGATTAGTLSVFQARELATGAASTGEDFQAFRESFIRLRGTPENTDLQFDN